MLVSDLSTLSLGLGVRCRMCGHRAFFTDAAARSAFGAETEVQSLPKRLKCQSCRFKGERYFVVTPTTEDAASSPFIAFAGRPLHLRCTSCWRDEYLTVENAVSRFGAEATFHEVRQVVRCSHCGVGDGKVQVGVTLDDLSRSST